MDLLEGGLVKILGTIRNWGRWSEIVAVRLSDNDSGNITYVNMLMITVLKWQVNLVGYKIHENKEFNVRESKKFIGWIVIIIIQ